MKIAICGSMSFAKEMIRAKYNLESKGHQVMIPQLIDTFTDNKQSTLNHPIQSDSENARLKREYDLIREHYEKIESADAILVLNYDKNEIANYIGGNTFLEIGFAHVLRKRIYLLNPIPEIKLIKDELIAMSPFILQGNLDNLRLRVAVGSENPVKLEAVRQAFQKVWPNERFMVEGIKVSSQVSDQPMSDQESMTGARNRAHQAQQQTNADYGVGLEGGLQKIGDKWFDCGWIVVVNRHAQEGIGSTARIETPAKMMELIHQGLELGDVNDRVFGETNSKQAAGHFGLMTNNAITRTKGYTDGVIMALSRFLHPELFE